MVSRLQRMDGWLVSCMVLLLVWDVDLLAETGRGDYDRLLSAIGHAEKGEWQKAADNAVELSDVQARAISLASIRQQSLGRVAQQTTPRTLTDGPLESRSQGGGAQADFGALIDLIQETISPESWEENGGSGKVTSFEGGIHVDAAGLLQERLGIKAAPRQNPQPSGANRPSARPAASSPPDATKGGDSLSLKSSRSVLRAISLNRLERNLQYFWAIHAPLPVELQYLAGLNRLRGVVAYPDSGDVVLIGDVSSGTYVPKGDSPDNAPANDRPQLQLDDLITHLRHAWNGGSPFGCSIDPLAENLARTQFFLDRTTRRPLAQGQRAAWVQELRDNLGTQRVTIFGIERSSRVGRVLVEADYHMKRVALGLEAGPEANFGYLQQLPAHEADSLEVMRWWFTLNFDSVLRTSDHLAYGWRGTGVQLQGENEFLTAVGERQHTGRVSPSAQAFAERFTNHFEKLARQFPIYADLQNQFALSLAATCVVQGGLAESCAWTAPLLGPQGKSYRLVQYNAPREVASIMNHRTLGQGVFVAAVSGGVRADPTQLLAPKTPPESDASLALDRLTRLRDAASPPIAAWRQWWWNVSLPQHAAVHSVTTSTQ